MFFILQDPDIALENSFFLDKAKIKEMSTHRVRILTQTGSEYVYTFEDIEQRNKLESWYTYWAMGYPVLSYSKSFSEFFDVPIDESALDRTTLSLDFFGFYFPRGGKTLLGFIVNGFEDEYKGNVGGFGVRGITYAFSVMHFLNHRIGQGFFISKALKIEDLSAWLESSPWAAHNNDVAAAE